VNLTLSSHAIMESSTRRLERVAEAISWPSSGDQEKRTPHVIWSDGEFEVALRKPGKEAAPGYRRPNPNDMLPIVSHNHVAAKNASFTDVFGELIACRPRPDLGRLLGALLVRSAYMADHRKETHGGWRYYPPAEAIATIETGIKTLYGVSVAAFLHYLDALAWQEDVKYDTVTNKKGKKYDITKGPGRENNLLTCANFLAADIGVVSFAAVLGALTRGWGVAPLSLRDAYTAFPELGQYEGSPRKKNRKSPVSQE
jgi:hypothetical protein